MQIIAEVMKLYNVFVIILYIIVIIIELLLLYFIKKIIKNYKNFFISSDGMIISVMESHFLSHTFVNVITKSLDIYIYSFCRHILIQIVSTQVKLKSIQSYRIAW